MKQKLVFLDIDGTLVLPLEKPTALVVQAVQAARKNGHKLFLCTGRNLPIIEPELLAIGFDGVVASAGAYIEAEGIVLIDDQMPQSKIEECLAIFHSSGVYCRIEDKHGIYIDAQMEQLLRNSAAEGHNSELVRMQRELESNLDIRPFSEYKKQGAYKICFSSTSLEQLEAPKKQLAEQFDFVVHGGGNNGIFNGEIIRKGLDKGEGIRRVCRYYNADLANTIAFGDSMNDLQMLQTAAVGVAMGNADTAIKAAADLVCKSVVDDGIYHAFRSLGLIE